MQNAFSRIFAHKHSSQESVQQQQQLAASINQFSGAHIRCFLEGENIQNQTHTHTHTPKQQAQSKVTTSSSVDFSSLFASFLKKH